VAMTLASNQAFGELAAAPSVRSPSMHSPHHHGSLNRHHRRNIGTFFPAVGGFFGTPFNAQPNIDVRQTITDGIYTCTYDIPWDWPHRCPPIVTPPELPAAPIVRAPSCLPQPMTVGMSDGKDQTITIVRCY
jgi:hypothetical protein